MDSRLSQFQQSARAALAIYSDTYFTRKGAGVGKAEALDALTAAAQELCLAVIGEDEPPIEGVTEDDIPKHKRRNTRNALRAAQRTALTKENQQ